MRSHLTKKAICSFLLLACSLFFSTGAMASAPVIPNSQFGENGLTLTDLGTGLDEAAAIGVQADGKIVVAGASSNGIDSDMAVVRYLSDGSLDNAFLFSAGPVIGAGFGDDGVRALVLGADGAIYLGGCIEESGLKSGVVVRLLANGQLDYNFGTLGVVVLENDGRASEFYDIALLSDGTIVAAGSAESDAAAVPPSNMPLLARFLPDGSLDTGFGSDGIQVDTDTEGVLHGVAVLPDNRILVGGYSFDDTQRKGLYLARHEPAGALDTSFGDAGRVTVFDPDEEILAYDIGLPAGSGIVAVGEIIAAGGATSMMAARFLADGSPDTGFSENGILVFDIGTDSSAYSVAALVDGTILAAGYRDGPTGRDTVVLRFGGSASAAQSQAYEEETSASAGDSGGTINISALKVEPSSFALADGSLYQVQQEADVITTSLSGSDEISRAITVLPDGTIYTAGSSGTGDDTAIMVASYSEQAPSGGAINSTGPVISLNYAIETAPITDISRVGALTGGTITLLTEYDVECVLICELACDVTGGTAEEIATCNEACPAACPVPTVTKRGVVYSVNKNPVYDENQSGDEEKVCIADCDAACDATGGTDEDISSCKSKCQENCAVSSTANPFGRDTLLNFSNYFVFGGQTDDGAGVGEYSSQIDDVNPQTTYYVRSYALLSDGALIYGNENSFKTNDSCFIATAAFGGIDDFAVRALRQFRDRYLNQYDWGRVFISTYYHFSPPIADMVAQSPLLRLCIIILLLPVVTAALIMLYLPPYLPFMLHVLLVLVAWRYWKRKGTLNNQEFRSRSRHTRNFTAGIWLLFRG